MDLQTNGSEASVETRRRRRRTGKKRLKFDPPQRFPRGVRDLWKSATSEEQQQAHRTCTQILALWLGKKRRDEVAKDLAIPGLRVWQLSQQALAGMLAGLLHQPRPRRTSREATMQASDEDPRRLRKLLAEKDRLIADQQDLIQLLTSIPKPASAEPTSEVAAVTMKTRAPRAARKREESRGTLPLDASAAPRRAEASGE